jgi:hypothetical protein
MSCSNVRDSLIVAPKKFGFSAMKITCGYYVFISCAVAPGGRFGFATWRSLSNLAGPTLIGASALAAIH